MTNRLYMCWAVLAGLLTGSALVAAPLTVQITGYSEEYSPYHGAHVTIDGPRGREVHLLGHHAEEYTAALVNDEWQVAFTTERDWDPQVSYVINYGRGAGVYGRSGWTAIYLAGVGLTYGYPLPVPDGYDKDESYADVHWPGYGTHLTALGSGGRVTGYYRVYCGCVVVDGVNAEGRPNVVRQDSLDYQIPQSWTVGANPYYRPEDDVVVTPEPGTYAVVGGGLLGLWACRRAKFRQHP